MSLRTAWGRMGVGKRIFLSLLALIVGYNVALGAVQLLVGGGSPGGPTSSSYATGSDGMAGWADLLRASGHPVSQLRVVPAKAGLQPDATLVIADPGFLDNADARAIGRFVARGGRVVVVGQSGAPLLGAFAGSPHVWHREGVGTAAPLAPVAETEPVTTVAGSGEGSYTATGRLTPVLGGDGRVTMVVGTLGLGRVVGVADSGIFQNSGLARRDNATLARTVVGLVDRPVVFLETVHGYGQSVGFDALPSSWRWGLAGLLLVLLAAMWSYGQRFGPPEHASRTFDPPRRAYVDALAADLARAAPGPEAVAPLQEHLRRELAARTGQPVTDQGALIAAASASGLRAQDLAQALSPPHSREEIVLVGRALTRLHPRTQPEEQPDE